MRRKTQGSSTPVISLQDSTIHYSKVGSNTPVIQSSGIEVLDRASPLKRDLRFAPTSIQYLLGTRATPAAVRNRRRTAKSPPTNNR